LKRVIGRRGIAAWRVTKSCGPPLIFSDEA
jgi:hypothetical protein